jgi:hypothetical protein
MFSKTVTNGLEILTGETAYLIFSIVPALGGKILSLYNKKLDREFLWAQLQTSSANAGAGCDYDSNFLGGIDELIPNDMSERIDSKDYPTMVSYGQLLCNIRKWKIKLPYMANCN